MDFKQIVTKPVIGKNLMGEKFIFLVHGLAQLKGIVNAGGKAILHGEVGNGFDLWIEEFFFGFKNSLDGKTEIAFFIDIRRIFFLKTIDGRYKIFEQIFGCGFQILLLIYKSTMIMV